MSEQAKVSMESLFQEALAEALKDTGVRTDEVSEHKMLTFRLAFFSGCIAGNRSLRDELPEKMLRFAITCEFWNWLKTTCESILQIDPSMFALMHGYFSSGARAGRTALRDEDLLPEMLAAIETMKPEVVIPVVVH